MTTKNPLPGETCIMTRIEIRIKWTNPKMEPARYADLFLIRQKMIMPTRIIMDG
jgi:hypothetical protein